MDNKIIPVFFGPAGSSSLAKDIAKQVHSDISAQSSISGYLEGFYNQQQQKQDNEGKKSSRKSEEPADVKPIIPSGSKTTPVEAEYLRDKARQWKEEVLDKNWSRALRDMEYQMEVSLSAGMT